MKTILAFALVVLAGAFENYLFGQEPVLPARQAEPALEQSVAEPPHLRQIELKENQRPGVKQVGGRQPERGAARPQIRPERGARPEIVRPGGRPAGAGRPQGARRPVRR